MNYIQISTTTETKSDAELIADVLLNQRLAACVQIIGPVQSHYRWKDTLEHSQEWLCLIKTRETLYKQVEDAIKKAHPYEVPEIIAVPIINGSPDYLKWIEIETDTH